MYIDGESIVRLASLLAALGTIVGFIVAAYKYFERDKKQTAKIHAIQEEQTMICFGVLACLKGLKEQGCNGPVSEALTMLEKHLNRSAHKSD